MTLLSQDSIQYKRRLVRELNKVGMINGFYANGGNKFNERCNRARFNGESGRIECRAIAGAWFLPSFDVFTDCNGGEINASIVA